MAKVRQKSEWDIIAEKWDKAAGETGIWHQQHDTDSLIFKLSGKVKNKKFWNSAAETDTCQGNSQERIRAVK